MSWRWVAKAIAQKAISVVPNAQRLNFHLQTRLSGRLRVSDQLLEQRTEWAGMHVTALERHRPHLEPGWTAVELGSGWFPLVPLCLYLAGAGRVWMVDLEDLGRDHLTEESIRRVLQAVRDGSLAKRIGTIDPDRAEQLAVAVTAVGRHGRHAALAALGLVTFAGDAREFDPGTAPDLICSNTVFEHIAPDVLAAILRRFRDIAGPSTVMSHLVDHCDHYAYVDEDIGVYHFLRYEDATWKLIDNSVQPLNRLRASDYRRLYGRAGIDLTEEHPTACGGLDLVGEPLARRFKEMDPDDVACTSSWLVSTFS